MKKVDEKLVTTRKEYLKWSFIPTFKRRKQSRNGAIAIEKEKYGINLNKPSYTGMRILGLSKALMQDFNYN